MDENTISVKELLEECKHWGVPYFQRGSVWTDENVALLLESLYWDTPCGNIILWENNDKKNGDSLISLIQGKNDKKEKGFTHLIIDGQQRTRNLYEALGKNELYGTEDDETSKDLENQDESTENHAGGNSHYVWAINLTMTEIFQKKGWLKEGKYARYKNLFAKIQDPKYVFNQKVNQTNPPPYPYQYNFLPIRLINKSEVNFEIHRKDDPREEVKNENAVFLEMNKDSGKDDEEIKEALKDVCERVRMIYNRVFYKTIIKDKTITDIIHTFIRINSGGRPVQQEEKAFSQLVRASEKTSDVIQEIFDKVHNQKNDEHSSTRDEYLARIAERQFGFRLFIRCFILAANYHSAIAMGTQALSYSVIQKDNLKKESVETIWTETKSIILALADLLRDERYLRFDSFSFLPDSRSLYPVMMLLIKYPKFLDGDKIYEKYKRHFSYILLNLLLGCGDSDKKTMTLVTLIRESALDGISMLRTLIDPDFDIQIDIDKSILRKSYKERFKKLQDEWKNITDVAQNKKIVGKDKTMLEERLENANAMNNRYILLLYVLERSRNAKDFYGESLPECKYKTEHETGLGEIRCSDNFNPERQHIVPYSALHFSDNTSRKGRISNDPANNIGNLTYISRELNHYDTGLGAKWLNLSKENMGHILFEDAILAYNKIRENSSEKKIDANLFRAWIKQRQKDIAVAFASWCTHLKEGLEDGLKLNEDEIPQAESKLLEQESSYTDNAFLPVLWNCDIEDFKLKQQLSWLAFLPGIKLEKKDGTITLSIGKIKGWKKNVSFSKENLNFQDIKSTLQDRAAKLVENNAPNSEQGV